ncbi:major capsid protein [Pseudoxanthomonas sp. USHLN014]|uniref:major capsid protein n=1 Tax=Pseudoxanthomonas sp. USHLN014 TaxID=3081297 RepID=UPI00301C2DA5
MDLQELVNNGVLSAPQVTATINNLPATPTRLAQMGLFQEEGLLGTDVLSVAINGHTLTLVPNVPRGAPAQPKTLKAGEFETFKACHLPQRSNLMADTLKKAFAPDLDPSQGTAERVISNLLQVHRRDNDYTMEYHRLGALKGLILDSDGSVILNLHEKFKVEPIEISMGLNVAGAKMRAKVLGIKRAIEDQLGGVPYTGIHVFTGSDFFDSFTGHASVEKAYDRWQEGAALRDDNRTDFRMAGVMFEELSGGFGAGKPYIASDEALAFPIGVPDQYITRFAPADYIETVTGEGLPYYSKSHPMEFNKGVQLESQSNPINLNLRPRTAIRLKK